MTDIPSGAAAGHETIGDTARTYEPDFYLAGLRAPRRCRADLITLAAYVGEIQRIPLLASEPMLGEIRLQWWRDAIGEGARGGLSGHPLADALVPLMGKHHLEARLLLEPVEGRSLELGERMEALDRYLDLTWGSAFRLAASIRGLSLEGRLVEAMTAAGRSFGAARAALRLPVLLSHGLAPWPLHVFPAAANASESEARGALSQAIAALEAIAGRNLEEARRLAPGLSRGARQTLAPLALVEPYFRALQRPGHDPLRLVTDVAPVTRVGRIWLSSLSGRA